MPSAQSAPRLRGSAVSPSLPRHRPTPTSLRAPGSAELVAEYQHDGPVMGTWELRQGNQATDGEPSFRKSGAARPLKGAGCGAEGRAGAERRPSPLPHTQGMGHWGYGSLGGR